MNKQEIWEKVYGEQWEKEVLKELTDEEKEVYLARKEYVMENGDVFFHPNKRIVIGIIKGLQKNKERYGAEYCPCRPVLGDLLEDIKNICPCVYHLDELKQDGICKCRLFVSEAFLKNQGYL